MKGTFIRTGFAASLAVGGFLASACGAFADGPTDFYTQYDQQRFFNQQKSARQVGMGGSSVATSADSSSILGNPAGMGWMKDAEVSGGYASEDLSGNDAATFQDVQQDRNAGNVLGAFPLHPYLDDLPAWGNLGLGWSGYNSDADDSLDSDSSGYALHAAYAKALNKNWSAGYSFAYMNDEVEFGNGSKDKMTDGVRQAVGAQYKASENTMYGVSTSYGFGTRELDGNSGSSDDIASWGIEGGVAHTMGKTELDFSLDYTGYNHDVGDDHYAWGFHTGVEQSLADWLKARVGYHYQANMGYDIGRGEEDNAKYNGISFGAGVMIGKHLRLDYGADYRAIGDNDWTHVVSASIPFSICKEDSGAKS